MAPTISHLFVEYMARVITNETNNIHFYHSARFNLLTRNIFVSENSGNQIEAK